MLHGVKVERSIICLGTFSFQSVFVLHKTIDSNYCVSIQLSFPMTFMATMRFTILSIIPTNQNNHTHSDLIINSIFKFSNLFIVTLGQIGHWISKSLFGFHAFGHLIFEQSFKFHVTKLISYITIKPKEAIYDPLI
jgi:hypothetical protein